MTQRCFSSTANMCFSLMHNAETSTHGLSAIICQHSNLSASSGERFTQLLEEFIFTSLQLTNRNSDLDRYGFSMWKVGTQTLSLLGELQRKDMITRSRMERLSRVVSSVQGRAEECLSELIRSSILRTCAKTERNFLNFATKWIEVISSRTSPIRSHMLGGDMDPCFPSMMHPRELENFADCVWEELNGWRSLELDLETHY